MNFRFVNWYVLCIVIPTRMFMISHTSGDKNIHNDWGNKITNNVGSSKVVDLCINTKIIQYWKVH